MSFPTISNTELNGVGATTLPNQPSEQGYSATQLKQKFDEPAKQLIAPKFNNLVSELQATSAATSLGAASPVGRTYGTTVQGSLNGLSADLETVETAMVDVETQKHSHLNKSVLDDLTDNSGVLNYDGAQVGTMDYNELNNQPQINGFPLSGNKSTADLGIVIPDELADLTADSDHRTVTDAEKTSWNGKSTVSFTRIKSAGEKIATISIDGTSTDIYASAGGGGGGGAVDSVNGYTGNVVLTAADVNALPDSTVIPAAQIQSDWTQADNTKLDYIKNKPTIPDAQKQADWTQADNTKLDYIKNKPTIDQSYSSATSATSTNAQSGKAVDETIKELTFKDVACDQGSNISSRSSVTFTDDKIGSSSMLIPMCDRTDIKFTTIGVASHTATVNLSPTTWTGTANFALLVKN